MARLGVAGRSLERLEHAEDLADAADEQPLLVDLDPDTGGGRKDDVVAGMNRHVDARGDHRIAMLGAITGLVSREGVEVEGAAAAAVSFPGFYDLLDSLRATTS